MESKHSFYEEDQDALNNLQPDLPSASTKKTIVRGVETGSPPLCVVVQGGHGSGKTTLIRSLIKYYTNQNITEVKGSVTVRNSKNQRLTLYECSNDISSLVDLAKIADVAILLIDARVGFEMETFEFISLLKNHGFTSVMGLLTHMDDFKKNKSLSKYKRQIKKRFQRDAMDKSKLFYFFGIKNGLYIKTQLHTIARHLKVIKPNVPGFRQNHPYVLCDRYDVTFLKATSDDEEDDVMVSFFGYVRGNHFNRNSRIHLNGLGDFSIDYVAAMDDPCPIETVEVNGKKKRTLKQKDKFLYAPYCNVNSLEYDRKSGYIVIPERQVTFTKGLAETEELKNDEGVQMVRKLQDAKGSLNNQMEVDELEIVEGVQVKNREMIGQQELNKDRKSNSDFIKEFQLKSEPLFYQDTAEKNLADEIYGDDKVDINGNDLLDTYKDLEEEVAEDIDIEALIRKCKVRFITGGQASLEEDDEDDADDENLQEDASNEKKSKSKGPNEDATQQSQPAEQAMTEEEIAQKLIDNENQLKPFLSNTSAYGLFELGSYIRIDFKHIKRKNVSHFSPQNPIIIATLSLQEQETQMGFMKIKFSKHLWYPKILKTHDPLILSIGWRKFQTTMAYCTEDKNFRLRLIKYTPKFSSCFAICYGPLMPINVAVVALQNNYKDEVQNFRICGKGDLIEVNHSFDLVKKLKLIGDPEEIYKKTAYIKGMFNSNFEVARYIGAKIKTVSGIRGIIKKQLNSKPEGRFRATFEDKIKKSDIVLLKTWTKVELNTFYNPIVEYNSKPMKFLRTMAQLRKDNEIDLKLNKDSLYTDIGREEQVFPSLMISKSLEKNLPFKSKNKAKEKEDDELFHLKKLGLPFKKKVKNYLTDNEKTVYSMLQRLQTLNNIKEKNTRKGEEAYQQKKHEEEEKEDKLRRKRQREKMIKRIKSNKGNTSMSKNRHESTPTM